MNDTDENRIKRRFVSVLAMLILIMYTGYILYNKPVNGSVELDAVDYTVMSFCIAVLLAIEAVKVWIKRKSGMPKTPDKNV